MFRHRRLARSARALRLAWERPSAHLAPRVARTLQTKPGLQWQRTAGSLRRTRSQGRHRGARKPSPRSALRASLGRFKRSRASSGSVYGRKPAAHRRSQGRHRGARQGPTSLRAPRVARTPSPRSALRASLGRFKRSRASSGSVRQEACGANAARAGIAARGRPHLAPRSARRSDRPLRSSPRSALRASLGTHGPTSAPRSWRRAWGAGAPRWRAKAAALRGNLMAPEAMRGNLMAPEGLLRGAGLVEGQLDGAGAIASRRSRARGKGAKVPRRRVEHPREKSNPLKVSCTARGLAEGSQMVLSGYLPADGCGEFALLRSRPHAVPPSSTTPTHSFENMPVSTVISGKTRHLHQG